MNILTFDIEEWAAAKVGGYASKVRLAEYDALLNRVLDTLDASRIKGTFFCTGLMAQYFPQVVRLIQSRGHEIGCHSHQHSFLNKMTEAEAREDTHAAIDALDQCIGQKVRCYRAPAFSIGENNKWVFEVLAENGITHDASIYPAARDFGGFPNFGIKEPCIIEYAGIKLKEFPICTTTLLGNEMAYSGGGYFRLFPLWLVKNRINTSPYSMCYFHIGDLLPQKWVVLSNDAYEKYYNEKGSLIKRYERLFKNNFGKKNALKKLEELTRCCDFVNLEMADKSINWINCPKKVF